jgi:hypothetical protein
MPASAYSLFYEANINRAVVDLALRFHSENPCHDHLYRLERGTQEWIAIILEWRIETAEKLRQACKGVNDKILLAG